MKILVVLMLVFSFAVAKDRPTVALVLSGGGARGGAHVGVLKVLEKNHIPIDMIVGTSMGSVVGGMYASGKTPQEIEKLLVGTKWKDFIRTDFDRQKIPMQKKSIDYSYHGNIGVGIDKDNHIVLPTGVLKREPLLMKFDEFVSNVEEVDDFDKLRIPFRAVATNIKNGEKVVLKSGSLSKAMYASSAIPGGLQPININGIDLVDGGVSDNIPIDVAKKMGADIVIAVDVSENFPKNIDVNSYFVVVGQLVNILMRKNANNSIKTLSKDDILITPKLDGYTGLDADKYAKIIALGYESALKHLGELKKLSLSDDEYAKYLKKHPRVEKKQSLIIDEIRIQNNTYLNDEIIREQIHQQVGKKFDDVKLREDIMNLYYLKVFDSITYDIKTKNNKNILTIYTKPSWNAKGDLLFGLILNDDFDGHSSYGLKLGYLMYGINSYGAIWRSDVEVGKRLRLYSEFYEPLDYADMFYIKPYMLYDKMTYVVPTDGAGNQELKGVRYGGGLEVGTNLSRSLRVSVGSALYRDSSKVKVFNYDDTFNAREAYIKALYDSLDNFNFPSKGFYAVAQFVKDSKAWGSDYDYEQIFAKIEKPLNYKNHTIIANAKYGYTDEKSENNQQITLYDRFYLGGMFNLSGYQLYSFAQNNVMFGSLMYRYRIKNGGFFGSLGMPLYAGATAEVGNSWDDDESFVWAKSITAGSVFVSADTPLGALYFTYGRANKEHESFYFYLGEKF